MSANLFDNYDFKHTFATLFSRKLDTKKYHITASIVLYNNPFDELLKAINSFLATKLSVRLYLIDNSEKESLQLKDLERQNSDKITYIYNKKNVGFGAGHNIAIQKILDVSDCHIVLNPDIYFEEGNLEKMYTFIQNTQDAGMLMPKVLYPNGTIQYLIKPFPRPYDLISRRFLPFRWFSKQRNRRYENRQKDYNKIAEIEHVSGCFMFIKTEALKKVGSFDEQFFIYMEDIDLSLRISKVYKNYYFPEATVYHVFAKHSYKQVNLLMHHIVSAVRYFNKWGWFPFF